MSFTIPLKISSSRQVQTIALLLILFFALVTKSWHLYFPKTYVFDEVYVGFTAEEYAKGNIKAWVWDYPTPKGFAYDWSHPPMGRLIMTPVIKLLGISSFSRRVVPMLAGVLITLLVYLLSKQLFPKQPLLWLTAACLSTLDGLLLTMSRISLDDTMLVLFITTSILFFWKKKYLFSSIFFGMAVATKWTAIYMLGYIGLVLLFSVSWKKNFKVIGNNLKYLFSIALLYLILGILIYVLSYLPLIWYYGWAKFVHLQQQMYWYHTGLVATHPWQSSALSWPILLRPVWFWVSYGQDTISNIYALGNPLVFWGGLLAAIFTLIYSFLFKQYKLLQLLFAYAVFWMPWIASPRIMFLYHYLPAIPFLTIILAFGLSKLSQIKGIGQILTLLFIGASLGVFIFFYPYWTGIPIPKDQVSYYQWLPSWK